MTLPNWLKKTGNFVSSNKYWLTLLVFFVFVTFFDANNLWKRLKTWRETIEVKREIHDYEDKLQNFEQQRNLLQSNRDELEKFARERYLMKKDNEDVYIVKEE